MTHRPSLHGPDWLAELRALALAGESLQAFLAKLATAAKEWVPEAASCTVRVRYGNRTLTAVTDEILRGLETAQDETGAGPGVAALEDGTQRRVDDVCRDERWPDFCRQACSAGLRSVLVVVLVTPEGERIGTVGFWSAATEAFGSAATDAAARFAEYAGPAVDLALVVAHGVEVNQDLHRALATRSVIDQALGVIMAEDRCSPEVAFETLRRASMNRNIKVHRLAADIVQGVSGKPPSDPPFTARTFSRKSAP